MADLFQKHDSGFALQGYKLGLRAAIALDVVKHCALVVGVVDGEDSAGRQKIALMAPLDVADRAANIAESLVDIFQSRGWIQDVEMTPDDEVLEQARLNRLRYDREYTKTTA